MDKIFNTVNDIKKKDLYDPKQKIKIATAIQKEWDEFCNQIILLAEKAGIKDSAVLVTKVEEMRWPFVDTINSILRKIAGTGKLNSSESEYSGPLTYINLNKSEMFNVITDPLAGLPLIKADRSKLRRKVITDKKGHKRTVWVNPEQETKSGNREQDRLDRVNAKVTDLQTKVAAMHEEQEELIEQIANEPNSDLRAELQIDADALSDKIKATHSRIADLTSKAFGLLKQATKDKADI